MDLVGRGGDESEVWNLILHCVRVIFSELHDVRAVWRGPFPVGKIGSILWTYLQAHEKIQRFFQDVFLVDPSLSHILNLHLQDNVVMESRFNDTVTSVEAMRDKMADM